MAEVSFSHPLMSADLNISVKPDQIVWSYGLNTQSYPTYGGEVVQILSVYFDDMIIAGTVSTVAEAERIYGWFITYMQYATQGRDNNSHDQHPVVFTYPARNWQFSIWPKALPGFTYGRDVIAPTWTLEAAVKEPDATFADQIKDFATFQAAQTGAVNLFGKATGNFGTTGDLENNPFASYSASPHNKGQTINQLATKALKALGDEYAGFVQAWASDDFTSLPQFPDISKPPGLTTANPSASKGKKQKKGKKVKNPKIVPGSAKGGDLDPNNPGG